MTTNTETRPEQEETTPQITCTGALNRFAERHTTGALSGILRQSEYATYITFDSVRNPEGETI